jgi:hypothetical protein
MSVTDPREFEARLRASDGIKLARAEEGLRRIRRIAHSLAQEDAKPYMLEGHRALMLEIEAICDAVLEP